MKKKYPNTRYYKHGDGTSAALSANRHGYAITYSRRGQVVHESTYYIRDGYNRGVGRTEALRELKRNHFEPKKG